MNENKILTLEPRHLFIYLNTKLNLDLTDSEIEAIRQRLRLATDKPSYSSIYDVFFSLNLPEKIIIPIIEERFKESMSVTHHISNSTKINLLNLASKYLESPNSQHYETAFQVLELYSNSLYTREKLTQEQLIYLYGAKARLINAIKMYWPRISPSMKFSLPYFQTILMKIINFTEGRDSKRNKIDKPYFHYSFHDNIHLELLEQLNIKEITLEHYAIILSATNFNTLTDKGSKIIKQFQIYPPLLSINTMGIIANMNYGAVKIMLEYIKEMHSLNSFFHLYLPCWINIFNEIGIGRLSFYKSKYKPLSKIRKLLVKYCLMTCPDEQADELFTMLFPFHQKSVDYFNANPKKFIQIMGSTKDNDYLLDFYQYLLLFQRDETTTQNLINTIANDQYGLLGPIYPNIAECDHITLKHLNTLEAQIIDKNSYRHSLLKPMIKKNKNYKPVSSRIINLIME